MADTSKINLGQLKTALTQAKNYTDNEIAGVTGVSKVEPEELDMPKVFFYGTALPTTKDNVNLTMDYVSNTAKFSSFVKLKCQGTSSMSYAKKNFTVSMFSDEARATKLKKDFKGWGAQSKFCLKANYVDTTHTRNISGARIAYDMVASRPDSAFKQQLLTAPRYGLVDGFPIKLYFNGEFYGIYTWNIPKDGWMFNMDESNPNHCVLCAEVNNNGNSSTINSCQFRKVWNGSGDWSVEVGTASANIKASFDRCINFVMTATDEEFKANIGDYFDLYSLLDYYCFSYLTCHLDGLAKNMLMATYDGVIWGASLYDMDSIYGVSWNGANYVATNYQCPEQYQETNSLLWQRIEANFGAELYARYLELRQGALSLSNIVKHVEEIYDVIPDRVFADEKAKWTSLPNVSSNTMTRFRNYMRDRAVYVDAQMEEIGTKVPCTGIVLSNDTLSFTTTDTQTLSVVVSPTNCTDTVTWSVSPSGIVTVDNGVVTPVTNGECTITATCGSYSDTCTVTVSLSIIECTGITLDQDTLTIDASTSTTAQLTATVTPENCTQPVIWSVAPEGIATVNNGLVTAVTNGETTVTATCGTQSATCAVTVSGMSESGGDTDIYATAEYAITEPRTFNGTSDYIDTGIQLFDTAKDFAVYIDYTPTAGVTQVSNATVLHCVHEVSPYRGLCMMFSPGSNDYFIGGQSSPRVYVEHISPVGNHKFIIQFANGAISSIKTINDGVVQNVTLGSTASNNPYVQVTENLLLGCYQNTSGTKGRYWNGTINKFAVWFKQLTDDEMNEVFGISGGDTDYTDISYIESTGTQYINTGIVPTASTKIELVADMSASKQYDHIFGSDNFMKVQWADNTGTAISAIKKNGSNQFYGLTLGKHTYVMDMTDTANVITIDGTNYGTVIGNVESTTHPVLLLSGYKDNGTVETEFCGIGKIYSCKIYYEDTLVANMKPVLTNSGTYGLLDTVNNTFYGSEVGSFTGGGTESGTNPNLVFQVNSASMNTADNTLTDNIAGISATLTGNPTVSDNQIAFTASNTFSFDISSLNLTNSNRTFRIKFTATTLDENPRNVIGLGTSNTNWLSMTTSYVNSNNLLLQHGNRNFTNNTVGATTAGNNNNRLSTAPITGQEYELVISENTDGNVRYFIDGTLVQDGTTTLFEPLYLCNTQGNSRFIGNYSLIEIYDEYCSNYAEFTNMVNS